MQRDARLRQESTILRETSLPSERSSKRTSKRLVSDRASPAEVGAEPFPTTPRISLTCAARFLTSSLDAIGRLCSQRVSQVMAL